MCTGNGNVRVKITIHSFLSSSELKCQGIKDCCCTYAIIHSVCKHMIHKHVGYRGWEEESP